MTLNEIYDRIEALLEKIYNNAGTQDDILNYEIELDYLEQEREILEGSQLEYCQS